MTLYDHRAVSDDDNASECRACGRPLVDVMLRTMRHRGEPIRRVEPKVNDRLGFGKALVVAERTVNEALTEATDPDQLARAVVERLYLAGLLRRAPKPP